MAEVHMEKSSIVTENSEPKKEKPQQIEPVVKSKVKIKKKGIIKRVVDAFVGEDVGDVKAYLLYDVTIPAVKNLLMDVVYNGMSMSLFGSPGRRRSNVYRQGGSSYISYNNAYDEWRGREYDKNRTYSRVNRRASHDFGDILFESRDDAEEVLDNLVDFVEIYGQATVSDLYDLVGKTCEYTDRGFGWKALGSSRVVRGRDGYILDLPPVEVLYN